MLILSGIALRSFTPQIVQRFMDAARQGSGSAYLRQRALLLIIATLATRLVGACSTYATPDLKWLVTNRPRGDPAHGGG